MVLFGGYSRSGDLRDTWTFVNGSWTKLSPAHSPTARYSPAMTYDARDGYVLLFGGSQLAGGLNDTWKFTAGNWTKLNLSVHPRPRWGAALTYDAKDGYAILFGGAAVGAGGIQIGLQDTWTFFNGSWTQVATPYHPSARAYAGFTFDSVDGYALLVDGFNVGTHGSERGSFSFVNGTWLKQVSVNKPPQRPGPGLAGDPKDGYVVLFGGGGGNDTWTYLHRNWTKLSPSTSPAGRDQPAMVFDAKDGYILLFGGSLTDTTSWSYLAGVWAQV